MIERIIADTDDGNWPGFIVEDEDACIIASALTPNLVERNGKLMTPGSVLVPAGLTKSLMVIHLTQLIRHFCADAGCTPDEVMDELNATVNTNALTMDDS